MELHKELLPKDKRATKPEDESALGFGRIFSDHMFMLDYEEETGWHAPRIVPYGPFTIDPAALVLHYGQEVFEGLKAYRGEGDGIYMFRPRANLQRMARSCERLCIPAPPEDLVLEAMYELIRIEKAWIPCSPGTSMYVRPNVIATEPTLGVKVSSRYLFYIIVGPVGPYYPEGFNPVNIYVEESYVRAVSGGLGQAKTAANYAASLLAAQQAHAKGYTQVLWLDACDKKGIEEVGTMNIFFVIGDEVVTPPLGGTILPGITRNSVLRLCNHWGLRTVERRLTIDDLIAAQRDGSLREIFGSGTAAVISPVGRFTYQGTDYQVSDGQTGLVSKRLYDEITGIQLGRRPDRFEWTVRLA